MPSTTSAWSSDAEPWPARSVLSPVAVGTPHTPGPSIEAVLGTTDPAGQSHVAAVNAYRALDCALRCVAELQRDIDGDAIAAQVFAAMMCAYSVLDTPVRAAAHGDGLSEGERLVADACEALRGAGATPAVARLREHLSEAKAWLSAGSSALARLLFDGGPPVSLELFLADTVVSEYAAG